MERAPQTGSGGKAGTVSEWELGETMASIRDVAIKAGVGIGTVSRALNGSGYISDETKQKIMQAVEELKQKGKKKGKTVRLLLV